MVSVGPVVSVPGGGGGGVASWRVTVTVRETLPLASVAVTAMLFKPTARGICG
jgi:hypothetical protein